ncbi:MAG TPA: lasso peptide biosynthesis B2 protein [Arenimonas sp.]|nr:lasso peptide biosynthesis B2 protein [Arenimonas sp.]
MIESRLKKWRALAFREKMLFLMFIFCLPLVAFAIRYFGYLRTRHFLSRFVSRNTLHQADATELAQAQRKAELLSMAGRHGWISATCLRQSVLLEFLLQRKGLAAEIKIGVRKQDALFDAHAWVELNGIPLAQDDLEHHRVLQ